MERRRRGAGPRAGHLLELAAPRTLIERNDGFRLAVGIVNRPACDDRLMRAAREDLGGVVIAEYVSRDVV